MKVIHVDMDQFNNSLNFFCCQMSSIGYGYSCNHVTISFF